MDQPWEPASGDTVTFSYSSLDGFLLDFWTFSPIHPANLTVQLSCMGAHVGKFFELRVWDMSTGEEVDHTAVSSIPLASFSIAVSGLINRHSYHADFYADDNENGTYDPSSTDHAWRLTVNNVTGNVTQNFMHITSYTEIQWPTLSVQEEGDLPVLFGLSQNYPNPFNSTTTIGYQLPEPGNVRLVIHNPLGERIKIVVHEREEAGFYSVSWDGTDIHGKPVSSGIYLYKIESDEFIKTMKMVLIK